MANVDRPETAALSLRRILARAFSVVPRRGLVALLLSVPLLYVPWLATAYFFPPPPAGSMPWSIEFVIWQFAQIGPSLTGSLLQAWIALELVRDADPSKPGGSLSVVLARFLPLVALAAILYLGGVVGSLALFVPGIWWGLATLVALPAAAVESASPIAAIRRSFKLTRGHRWAIFGYGLVTFAPLAIAVTLISEIATGWAPLRTATQAPIVLLGVRPITDTLFGVFAGAYGAAFYQDLVSLGGSARADVA